MNNTNGYIKLHRKMLAWGWYQDSVVKDVFIHLLLTANFRPKEWMGIQIGEGQLIVGTQKLADELGFSRQQIRTALNKLKSTNEITITPTNRFTLITIVNWRDYQSEKVFTNQQINQHFNQQSTNKQPTDNQQITNKQPQLKKDNNIIIIKREEYITRVCAREIDFDVDNDLGLVEVGDGVYEDDEGNRYDRLGRIPTEEEEKAMWADSIRLMNGEE